MKINENVICIDNKMSSNLEFMKLCKTLLVEKDFKYSLYKISVDNEYKILEIRENEIFVENDDGSGFWYIKSLFATFEEYRNIKIDHILQ